MVLVAVAVMLAAVACGSRDPSPAPGAAALCDSVPAPLSGPATHTVDGGSGEVFRLESESFGDSSTRAVLYRSGDLVVDGDVHGDRTPKRALLTSDGMEVLERCITESGFAGLDDTRVYGTETSSGESVCINDAATAMIEIQSGDIDTSVQAYALGPSMALFSRGGDCSQPFYPEALTLVYDTLATLTDQTQGVGEPYETPQLRVWVEAMPPEDAYGFYEEALDAPVIELPPGIELPADPGGSSHWDRTIAVTGDSAERWRGLLPSDQRAAWVERRVRALDGQLYLASWVPIMPGDESE